MAFSKMTDDVMVISQLEQLPNTGRDNLTWQQLEAKFDEGPRLIKEYLNALVDALAAATAAGNIGVNPFEGVSAADLQSALEQLQANIKETSMGAVQDGSISTVKLAAASVTGAKLANGAVGTAQLAAGAVGTEKLADGSVTAAKIPDGTVSGEKLAAGAVTFGKLSSDVVGRFYQKTENIPMEKTEGRLSGDRLILDGGDLGAIKLVSGVHYFDSAAEAPVEAGRLVFIKASD